MQRPSPAGLRVFGDMVSSAHRPRVLHDAFLAGTVPVQDLPELIAFAWLHDDSPTSEVTESDWLQIFAAVGFFSYPAQHARPMTSITLYRATCADRLLRMSWTGSKNLAIVLGRRHTRHGSAAVYKVAVEPDHVLAFLGRQDEGWTVVVHPDGLAAIEYVQDVAAVVPLTLAFHRGPCLIGAPVMKSAPELGR